MSSILSEQNLQTLRRRNIGRRCWSFPCAPTAGLPRPPPVVPLLPPFIADPPHRCHTDRPDPRRARHAVLHRAGAPAAGRGQHGGAGTFRCGGRPAAPPPPTSLPLVATR